MTWYIFTLRLKNTNDGTTHHIFKIDLNCPFVFTLMEDLKQKHQNSVILTSKLSKWCNFEVLQACTTSLH